MGGSGSIEEIYQKVAENLRLPEDVLSIIHNPQTGNQTEVAYRLAWARTYLKKYGMLENSGRGVWTISQKGSLIKDVDSKEVVRFVQKLDKQQKGPEREEGAEEIVDPPEEVQSWRAALYSVLTNLDPSAFERLVKRLLRESGFVHVEVTGRSGDGGIDGKGIARTHGFLSFHVVFQCKRYQGTVGSSQIRDFRGAPPIDLVDGDQLADKLKELSLGIKTETVERVKVEEDWFKNL